MFITFEGIDFCGKSTQVKLLKNYFEDLGRQVVIIREPGGTLISEKVRDILLDKKNSGMKDETEILLFSASRAQLVREIILPNLNAGNVVISDRFFDSSTAYQGYGRGVSLDFINTINRFAAGPALPKLTFILDISIEEVERRQKKMQCDLDRMELSNRSFFERVRTGYLTMAEQDERFKVLSAEQSIQDIHEQILQYIKQ